MPNWIFKPKNLKCYYLLHPIKFVCRYCLILFHIRWVSWQMSFSSAEILVFIALPLTCHVYFNRGTFLFIIWNLRLSSLVIHCMGPILLFFTKSPFYACIFLACPRLCSRYFPLKLLVGVVDTHVCEMIGAKSFSQLWTSLCLTLFGCWGNNFTRKSFASWKATAVCCLLPSKGQNFQHH